ncbi:MAG: helix-turn-helix transcriptional regulator [Alphaproteobacteria bacterium]|nr:helix-turn-helix transcriptional regulator [Alphaproteobacteria bacterium]
MSGPRYAQFCALARAAEVIGERWTLLIVRELLLGPKRFSDLSQRLAGVSPTLLTSRLNALIEAGVIRRETRAFNTQTYELTEIGRGLQPAIRELIRWGGHFLFPMRSDDEFEPDWVLLGLDAIARREASPATSILLQVRHKAKSSGFLVEGGRQGTTIARSDGPGGATIEARFDTLLRLIATDLSIEEAEAGRLAKIEGSMQAARSLPLLFDLAGRRSGSPG